MVFDAKWVSLYRLHHRMAEWFRVGNVFLLAGDAAHVHSPVGGQGMNTGIQDAYNHAWKLAMVINGQAGETLLDSYSTERMPVARALLNGTDKAFNVLVSDRKTVRLARKLGARLFARWRCVTPAAGRGSCSRPCHRSGSATPSEARPSRPACGPVIAPGASVFTVLTGPDHHLAGARQITAKAAGTRRHSLRAGRPGRHVHVHPISGRETLIHDAYGVTTPGGRATTPFASSLCSASRYFATTCAMQPARN